MTKATWNAHCAPRRRISEPWQGGEQAALRRILTRLWNQYLEIQGLDWASCPWDLESAAEQAAANGA